MNPERAGDYHPLAQLDAAKVAACCRFSGLQELNAPGRRLAISAGPIRLV